ncbi:MAG: DUF2917 domain-containing protein [Sulfuritalea sp.]|nr:DUF2917 domain-containing protein [Sulfuritalea sp.]
MTAPALSTPSLIGIKRSRRAALMRPVAAANHATEFHAGMHAHVAPETEQSLAQGQLSLLPARELNLLCLAGELWLTRDGDAEDYILGPGQRLAIGRKDQAAVQALRASRFRLSFG